MKTFRRASQISPQRCGFGAGFLFPLFFPPESAWRGAGALSRFSLRGRGVAAAGPHGEASDHRCDGATAAGEVGGPAEVPRRVERKAGMMNSRLAAGAQRSIQALVAQSPPFDLLVFPSWSIFSGPKR